MTDGTCGGAVPAADRSGRTIIGACPLQLGHSGPCVPDDRDGRPAQRAAGRHGDPPRRQLAPEQRSLREQLIAAGLITPAPPDARPDAIDD